MFEALRRGYPCCQRCDFLFDALPEIVAEVFAQVAHLLNLDLEIVFVDIISTYFEVEAADELTQL